jgi:UDP-N-acetylglucosamine:LPS N-acetylglucosamine transferase
MIQLRPKPLVLSVLTGGGFSFETNTVLRTLGDSCRLVLLSTEFGGTPPPTVEVVEMRRVPSFETITRPSKWQSAKAFVETFYATMGLLVRHPVDLVLTVGNSQSVPILIAARLLMRRSVFIESVTRVAELSKTGILVRRFRLASVFLVQWPGLARAHQGVRVGTIL